MEALFGLIGVIVGSLITGLKELWVGWYHRKKNQEYLAVRVATYLDYYSERCRDVAGDNGDEDQHGYTHTTVDDPVFNLETVEVEWKSIPSELMYRILNFSNLIVAAEKYVKDTAEYSDPPDYTSAFEARQIQYAKLGLEAIDIANILRKEHKLPARDYGDSDPETFMRERIKLIEKRQIERHENSKALLDKALKSRQDKEQNANNNQVNQGQG